jgi:hypothetical protein
MWPVGGTSPTFAVTYGVLMPIARCAVVRSESNKGLLLSHICFPENDTNEKFNT